MSSEAQARITINRMLEEAGWRFFPDSAGRRENIVCEHRVRRKVFAPNIDLGADFEHAPDGFVDYVLLNTDDRPVAVAEAKREGIDPLTAKELARDYANSTGLESYILDGEVRQCLEKGEFARLRAKDSAFSQSVKALGPERLQTLFRYIRSGIPLDDFAEVA